MKLLIGLLLSYLLGSVPTAYIFGRLYKKIDIREYGSGNVGATNVFRTLGKWPGIIVLVIDIIKGTLAVLLISALLQLDSYFQMILIGMAAVVGHNWTVFLKFKGGKGIATSLGVLIGLSIKIASIRFVIIITLLVWIISFLLSGFVSLASLIAATLLPVIMIATSQAFEIVCLGIVFCVFVALRHRMNIKRLLAGQEPRVKIPFLQKDLK